MSLSLKRKYSGGFLRRRPNDDSSKIRNENEYSRNEIEAEYNRKPLSLSDEILHLQPKIKVEDCKLKLSSILAYSSLPPTNPYGDSDGDNNILMGGTPSVNSLILHIIKKIKQTKKILQHNYNLNQNK
jgi:hypothetical protein